MTRISHLTLILLMVLGLIMIFGTRALFGGENLPVYNGISAATSLPADEEASKVAFETATFGLG